MLPGVNATRRSLSIALGLGAGGGALLVTGASRAAEPDPAASQDLTPLPRFTQTGFADSALVGRLLGAGDKPLTPAELLQACAQASLCLLGEQHDHPDHHALQAWIIGALASRGQLAAVALEMAAAGRSFDGARDASEASVRAALHWNNDGWPWKLYAGPVMAAVRAGVPVVGVNLPDAAMMTAYRDPKWDASVPADVRQRVLDDVRDSHCGLLPAAQLPAMARIQFARDASMAAGCSALQQPQRTVVLLTGSFHADKTLGIAQHLAPVAGTQPRVFSLLLQGVDADTAPHLPSGFDAMWFTPSTPPVDHCAALRKTLADKTRKP